MVFDKNCLFAKANELQKAYVFVLLYQAMKLEQRLHSFASYRLYRLMEKCKCVDKWEEGEVAAETCGE